jgi:HEPN domain-containing protein
VKYIRQWLELAEEDLRVVEIAFEIDNSIPYRIIAFHAQQAAEKFLKALLVYYNIDFPYTHDLYKLLELLPEAREAKGKLEDITKLTDYAVNRRYPDFYRKLSLGETKEAAQLAKLTADYVRNKLEQEGFSL